MHFSSLMPPLLLRGGDRSEPPSSRLSSFLSKEKQGHGRRLSCVLFPTISCYQIKRSGSLNACLSEKHSDKSHIPHMSIHPAATLTCQAYIMGKQNLFPFFFLLFQSSQPLLDGDDSGRRPGQPATDSANRKKNHLWGRKTKTAPPQLTPPPSPNSQ